MKKLLTLIIMTAATASTTAMAAIDTDAVNASLGVAETSAHAVGVTVISIVAGLTVVGIVIGLARKL